MIKDGLVWGIRLDEFEAQWSEYTGLKHAHFLSSNTVGLHLALKILKEEYHWKDNDEIITTPQFRFHESRYKIAKILCPIFADVDESLCLHPKSILDRITEKTRAIISGWNRGTQDDWMRLKKFVKSIV